MKGRSTRLVGGLIAVLLVACTGTTNAQQASGGPTQEWVERMAKVYYEPRPFDDVRAARSKDTPAIDALLKDFPTPLLSPMSESDRDSATWLLTTQYRSIWNGDALLRSAWDLRKARFDQLPEIEIYTWQPVFSAIEGMTVPYPHTTIFIAELSDMFPKETLDRAKSEELRTRMRGVPAEVAKSLSAVLRTPPFNAAILILQNPEFFDKTGLRREALDKAVQQLQARLAPAKQ